MFGDYRLVTDENGGFSATGVAAKQYDVLVGPPKASYLIGDVFYDRATRGGVPKVTVVAGRATRFEERLRRGGRIELRVKRNGAALDADQLRTIEPVMRVDLGYPRGDGLDLYLGQPEIEAGLLVFWGGVAPRQDYEVTLGVRGFADVVRRGITVIVGKTTTVTIDFDPDESTGVTGIVTGEDGHAKADADVWIVAGETVSGRATTDAVGRYRILGASPGRYRLDGPGLESETVTIEHGRISSVDLRARD